MHTSSEPKTHSWSQLQYKNITLDVSEDGSSSSLQLTLHGDQKDFGSIEVASIDALEIPRLFETFLLRHPASDGQSHECQVTPAELEEVLSELAAWGHSIHSDLGSTLDEIVRAYQMKLGHQDPPCPEQNLAKVFFLDIQASNANNRKSASMPFRWVHIENPNETVIASVAKNLHLQSESIENCLRSGQHPKTFRYRDFLFCLFDELDPSPENPYALTAHDVSAILGDHIVLTMSSHHSAAIERVRAEIQSRELNMEDIENPNYLFSRILGSSIHRNEEVVSKLHESSAQFLKQSATRLPSQGEITVLRDLSTSIEVSRYSVSCLNQMLMALREDRNLFGAQKPRDALDRYTGMATDILGTLSLVDHTINELRSEWRTRSENVNNDLLFRLTVLSGATAVLSTIFGFFGQNFSQMPFSDNTIWIGAMAGLAVSAALVFGLIRKQHQHGRLNVSSHFRK